MQDVIRDYIKLQPESVQEKLYQIRKIIKETAPLAAEKISWRMPTFYLNGNLVHFAAHKNHIGFYPGAEAIEEFKNETADFITSKGGVQFPYKKELPESLIKKIVEFRVKTQTKDAKVLKNL